MSVHDKQEMAERWTALGHILLTRDSDMSNPITLEDMYSFVVDLATRTSMGQGEVEHSLFDMIDTHKQGYITSPEVVNLARDRPDIMKILSDHPGLKPLFKRRTHNEAWQTMLLTPVNKKTMMQCEEALLGGDLNCCPIWNM